MNTLRPRENSLIAVILETFSIAFSYWSCCAVIQIYYKRTNCHFMAKWVNQHWFRPWLGTKQATSHYLHNDGLVYWRIYTSPRFNAWRRHQMEKFSTLVALCEGSIRNQWFPTQRPETRSFGVFFDLRLNKWLSKQSRRRWFETPLGHYNVTVIDSI